MTCVGCKHVCDCVSVSKVFHLPLCGLCIAAKALSVPNGKQAARPKSLRVRAPLKARRARNGVTL